MPSHISTFLSPHVQHSTFNIVRLRPSDLGYRQAVSELPRETPLGDLAERKIIQRLTEAGLEEKQEVKEKREQQRCKEGSEEGLEEWEADHRIAGEPGCRGGKEGVREDGSGGEQGGEKSAAPTTTLEVMKGKKEGGVCAAENVQQQDEVAIEAVVSLGWEDLFI